MGIFKSKRCPVCNMPKPCWCPKVENCTTCGQPHPCRCGGGW